MHSGCTVVNLVATVLGVLFTDTTAALCNVKTVPFGTVTTVSVKSASIECSSDFGVPVRGDGPFEQKINVECFENKTGVWYRSKTINQAYARALPKCTKRPELKTEAKTFCGLEKVESGKLTITSETSGFIECPPGFGVPTHDEEEPFKEIVNVECSRIDGKVLYRSATTNAGFTDKLPKCENQTEAKGSFCGLEKVESGKLTIINDTSGFIECPQGFGMPGHDENKIFYEIVNVECRQIDGQIRYRSSTTNTGFTAELPKCEKQAVQEKVVNIIYQPDEQYQKELDTLIHEVKDIGERID